LNKLHLYTINALYLI